MKTLILFLLAAVPSVIQAQDRDDYRHDYGDYYHHDYGDYYHHHHHHHGGYYAYRRHWNEEEGAWVRVRIWIPGDE
jgi:hypothetical protein